MYPESLIPGARAYAGTRLKGKFLRRLEVALLLMVSASLAPPSRAEPPGPAILGTGDVSAWRETAWPFLRDAWPAGRAFGCKPGQCGAEVSLYARVKVGFCDCSRGVSDDEELDRVADVDLLSSDFAPLAAGDPVKISGIDGRKRLYSTNEKTPRRVIVFAGGRNCNAFVAMAVSAQDIPSQAIKAAEALLDDPAFMRWVVEREGGG